MKVLKSTIGVLVIVVVMALAMTSTASASYSSKRSVCAIPGIGNVACSTWHWSKRVMYSRPCEGRIPLVGPIFSSHQSYPPSNRNC